MHCDALCMILYEFGNMLAACLSNPYACKSAVRRSYRILQSINWAGKSDQFFLRRFKEDSTSLTHKKSMSIAKAVPKHIIPSLLRSFSELNVVF